MPPESAPDLPRLAIVLAGGSGRRLGLVDKPALLVGGRTLLSRALDAVAPALTVVVGPPRDLAVEILQTREDPPKGGPAAAVVAGLVALSSAVTQFGPDDLVAVVAADLPGIDAAAIRLLTVAVLERGADGQVIAGAVMVDPNGRDQYLFGVWHVAALRRAAASRPSWDGARLADLLTPLVGARVPATAATAADIDTAADLVQWGAAAADPRVID